MVLEDTLKKIRSFILGRYKGNLVAILVFGTANTGEFREGKSDVDTMIFLKKQSSLNFEANVRFLLKALKEENFATQYFNTLGGIRNYIQERGSWSAYITIISKDGSRVLYLTPEFEATKRWLEEHPIPKQSLRTYLEGKDRFELDGYFRERRGFDLTKALVGHIRRKLQIMHYFLTGDLIFDYSSCLIKAELTEDEREKLESLYESYQKRRTLTEKEVGYYDRLARQLTGRISWGF